MDPIHFAIQNPVKVAVGVLLILLFGALALFAIPIQLTPNVDQPIISVTTNWTGRSPQEVEREIVEEQEDKLKGVGNLRKMTSTAQQGEAKIELEFQIGTDMSRALQEVSDGLREVPSYPDEVDEPVIVASNTSQENAIAWIILTSDDPNFDVQGFYDTADKRIKPLLERVSGVDEVNIYGGREREVQVRIDPTRLAQRGVGFGELASALRNQNVNVSAGEMSEGRLDVRIRTLGQYDTLDQVRRTVIRTDEGGPIRVGDIADVVLTLEKQRGYVRSKGEVGLAFQVIRETGSNVMTAMAGVRGVVGDVNRPGGLLEGLDPSLHLRQVYDETIYIDDAIGLVQSNLVIGAVLAVTVLLLFLSGGCRWWSVAAVFVTLALGIGLWAVAPNVWITYAAYAILAVALLAAFMISRPTAVVALSIPISVVGTFVVMTMLGRNLNVISLAGMAFAVGMVVDAAIVVLENIDRHLSMGKGVRDAAFEATTEVWGAVLASTLTTLAVFVPVLFMQEEAGQLFRDIALAICAAVSLSLLVSVTVIPAASARFLRPRAIPAKPTDSNPSAPSVPAASSTSWVHQFRDFLAHLVTAFAQTIYWLTGRDLIRTPLRIAIVLLFTVVSLGGAYYLMPPTTYLPAGNRNLVFGIMFNPPGYSVNTTRALGTEIESKIRPYWQADSYAQLAQMREQGILPPPPPPSPFGPPAAGPPQTIPPIDNFFLVNRGGTVFMGAMSSDKNNVKPLEGLLSSAMTGMRGGPPGSFGFASQASLFGRGLGGSNSIDIDIAGNDLPTIQRAATAMEEQLIAKYGRQGIGANPANYALPTSESRLVPDPDATSRIGLDTAVIGLALQAMVDGARVGDYRFEGDAIDLKLIRDPSIPLTRETILAMPLVVRREAMTNAGPDRVVPLGQVVNEQRADAPQEIRRIEQLRAITLTVTPPEGEPLEQALVEVGQIERDLRDAGTIPPTVEIRPAGTADKLTQVRTAMLGDWAGFNFATLQSVLTSRLFIALLVTFLLMAALFESFLYPAVIMFSVPLAAIGGFLGLAIAHYFIPTQQLDVLTMLGFVILIGIVVNNAILIVHQSLNFMRGTGDTDADSSDHHQPLPPRAAIAESVRTRVRPILMTTLTSVLGMLPLVLMPGPGSELYRGLGSVVVGGLVVSTLFTLLVVPVLLSLVIDAKLAAYRALNWHATEFQAAP